MNHKNMTGMMFSCIHQVILDHYEYQEMNETYQSNVSMIMLMLDDEFITIEELKEELDRRYTSRSYKDKAIAKFIKDVIERHKIYRENLKKHESNRVKDGEIDEASA